MAYISRHLPAAAACMTAAAYDCRDDWSLDLSRAGRRGRPEEGEIAVADVVALVDDLFFQSKMVETARNVGVGLQTVSSGAALVAAATASAGGNPPRLLLVDLNARQGPLEAIEQLHAAGSPLPVIAFLSHVQTELAQRARVAGCQQVLPRSKFTAELADILSQAKT
jgi:CheY-like chemotaxis protein